MAISKQPNKKELAPSLEDNGSGAVVTRRRMGCCRRKVEEKEEEVEEQPEGDRAICGTLCMCQVKLEALKKVQPLGLGS